MNAGTYFAEGGPFMYAIVALNTIGLFVLMLALVLAILARAKGKAVGAARFFATVGLIGCFIPLCAGLGGRYMGNRQTEQAVALASPESKDDMQAAGEAIASIPFKFGGCSTMCCLVPAIVIMMVLPRKRRKWEEALDDTVA